MTTTEPNSTPPSLRIAELDISGFRTFRDRTVIPFRGQQGQPDGVAVFHGPNGSGKSNALAALDLFFQTAVLALRQSNDESEILIPWDSPYPVTGIRGDRHLVLAYQDRPHGIDAPTEIEVAFADERLGRLRSTCTPAGNQARIRLGRASVAAGASEATFLPVPKGERDQLVTWLSTPRGPGSRPLMIVDSRRRRHGLDIAAHSLMPSELGSALFELRTSRRPHERVAWRAFVETLGGFESLRGKEISVEQRGKSAELIVEEPGRTVLALDDLSSGEQQVVVLCAASLFSASPVLAIQEPEISLDHRNQRLFHDILTGLMTQGLLDQLIVESHVPTFDGPEVIRFSRRPDGTSEVRRDASANEQQREIKRRAEERGAAQRWVTAEGYTQVPDPMREELRLQSGGRVWFLKGPHQWEAWPETQVDEVFGGSGEGDGDG